MLPQLRSFLQDNWFSYFKCAKPKGISFLGIPGSAEGGTTSFLGFDDKSPMPLFAVKVCRNKLENQRVRNEANLLSHLQGIGEMSSVVPFVHCCEEIDGNWILVQSILDGYPMIGSAMSDGQPDLIEAAKNIKLASEWLQILGRTTTDNGAGAKALILEQAFENIAFFLTHFDLSVEEIDFLNTLQKKVETIDLGSVVQHGDFSRHNILISGPEKNTVKVIDWTDGQRAGFPLFDLFFFLINYYLQIRTESSLEGMVQTFQDLFFNETPHRNMAHNVLRTFCEQTAVDQRDISLLFALFLVDQSVVEFCKIEKCAQKGIWPRFAIYLADLEDLSYDQAYCAQFWKHFFKVFVKRQKDIF